MQEVVDAEAAAHPRTALERILGLRPLTPAARRAYGTALGDVVVAPVLEQLGWRWDVLHDIPVRTEGAALRSIDHLVIGPGGVFAIRALHCAADDVVVEGDALTVGGVARDDLLELAESARAAGSVLSASSPDVVVVPVFVAVDPGRLVVRVPPDVVAVIEAAQLRRTLVHRRPRLRGEAAASISDLADRAGTWPAAPDLEPGDHDELHRRFGMIRERVTIALRRRTGWAIAVFSVGAATMCTAIAAYVGLVVMS